MTDRDATGGIAWDFSKIPIYPPDRATRPQASSPPPALPLPGIIQPKLVIGEVNDPLEHEADRVADKVMYMPDPAPSVTATPPQISRKRAACVEDENALPLRTKPARPAEAAASEVPPIVHEVLRSPGQLLDDATRGYFERRLGEDFSRIRIHADASAAKAAVALDARAFAAEPHVIIDPAEYAGDRGRRLIAHELVHTVQQRGFALGGTVIQRQPRSGLRLALPKAEIKAIGNADVNQIVDAFPASMMNGQTFSVTIESPDGTRRTFGIEIMITPGRPPITGTSAAKTKKKPMPPGSTTPPTFAIEIFQALPDPVRTLFHEFLHLRLRIDQELPDNQRSQTFARYSQQFQMGTDEALLPATGTFDTKKAVMDKISAVRNWFQTFVTGFKTPAVLSSANDGDFLQHFIEEKFVNQEAAAAKISPGAKKPPVAAPVTTGKIATRYAGTVADIFRVAANAQGLQGAVAAAETRAKASTALPSLDDLNAQLAAALQRLFDALDAQLAQIAAFKQRTDLPKSPKELSPREQVDEMQRNEPPLRLTP
ncbi:MAG: DUF4157 domain-containing protein [Methylocella sp.]